MAFQSQTYGKLNIRNIPEKIMDYARRMDCYNAPFLITVGTDSQNFSDNGCHRKLGLMPSFFELCWCGFRR